MGEFPFHRFQQHGLLADAFTRLSLEAAADLLPIHAGVTPIRLVDGAGRSGNASSGEQRDGDEFLHDGSLQLKFPGRPIHEGRYCFFCFSEATKRLSPHHPI